jgi:hypothetical protein
MDDERAIPAHLARRLGSYLLTETMDRRPDLGFDSYDRLFPNQDTLPKGGFGNLIALPLQKRARELGNTVFLDEQFTPYPDQWAFLGRLSKISQDRVARLVRGAEIIGRVIGVRMVATEEDDAPWNVSSSHRHGPAILEHLPESLNLVLADQIYIARENLPAPLRNRLLHLAAFQNPEFYRAQSMRLPTYDKPRVIHCAEEYPQYLVLPRGCLDEVKQLLKELKINVVLRDERYHGVPFGAQFCGTLRGEQQAAAEALKQDIGVLAATTAFGKTVVAAWLIAQRRLETLPETARPFRLNEELPIPFDGWGRMEVDLFCPDARLVIELDGAQHLADPEAYRRDRRKDALLQQNGYFVLRFLAEDLGKRLDYVLDTVFGILIHRQGS